MYVKTESGYAAKDINLCIQTQLAVLDNLLELNLKLLNSVVPSIATNYLQQSALSLVYRCQVKELQKS